MVERYDEIQKFTVTELCSWLEGKEDITEDIISAVETNRVNGKTFVDLSDGDLKELFSVFGDRKAVQRIVESLKPQPQPPRAVLNALQPVGVSEKSSFKIPDRFSRATMEHLDNGEITDGVRCEIVNAICIPWYPVCPYPSKEEFTAVSVQLVQKYPILRDSTGNGYGSWKQQIRRKFKNMRAPPTNRSKRVREEDKENNDGEPPLNTPSKKRNLFKDNDIEVSEEDEEKYKTDIRSLQDECAKDKPNKKLLKKLMKNTLAMRRHWIDKECPTVLEILERFPSLKSSWHCLQREFVEVLKCDLPEEEDIKDTWSDFLQKVNRNFDIEASMTNLQKLKDEYENKKLLYSDEAACKCSCVTSVCPTMCRKPTMICISIVYTCICTFSYL